MPYMRSSINQAKAANGRGRRLVARAGIVLGGVFAGAAAALVLGTGSAHADTTQPTEHAVTAPLTKVTDKVVDSLGIKEVSGLNKKIVNPILTQATGLVDGAISGVVELPTTSAQVATAVGKGLSSIGKTATAPVVAVVSSGPVAEIVRPIVSSAVAVTKIASASKENPAAQTVLATQAKPISNQVSLMRHDNLAVKHTHKHVVPNYARAPFDPSPFTPAAPGVVPGGCGQCGSAGGPNLLGDSAFGSFLRGHGLALNSVATLISAYVPSVQVRQPGVTPD
jgi:hypothetical protein